MSAIGKKEDIKFEVLSEFMMTEPKSWSEVSALARELRDMFQVNSFYAATPDVFQSNIRNSNTCFGIELGARVAVHQNLELRNSEIKSELQKALDYSLCIIVFQKYLENMSHRNVLKGVTGESFEKIEKAFGIPVSALFEQLRDRAYDDLENAINIYRQMNRSIPPASAIEAVIREQFHKQRKGPVPNGYPNVPDFLYQIIPMLLELPQDRDDGRKPIINPPHKP